MNDTQTIYDVIISASFLSTKAINKSKEMSQKSVASLHMQAKWRRRFYGKEDNLLPGFMLLLDFLRGLSFGLSFLVVFAILVENTASSQFFPTKYERKGKSRPRASCTGNQHIYQGGVGTKTLTQNRTGRKLHTVLSNFHNMK